MFIKQIFAIFFIFYTTPNFSTSSIFPSFSPFTYHHQKMRKKMCMRKWKREWKTTSTTRHTNENDDETTESILLIENLWWETTTHIALIHFLYHDGISSCVKFWNLVAAMLPLSTTSHFVFKLNGYTPHI
jgi:hypothetical protein